MRRDDLARYNAPAEARGEKDTGQSAQCRPAASGSSTQPFAASRPLRFFAYGVGGIEGWTLPTGKPMPACSLRWPASGLPVCEHRAVLCGAEQLAVFIGAVRDLARQPALRYRWRGPQGQQPGELQSRLGFRSRGNRAGLSPCKLPAAGSATVVEAIDPGWPYRRADPVARLKPVFVGGVTVTNAPCTTPMKSNARAVSASAIR